MPPRARHRRSRRGTRGLCAWLAAATVGLLMRAPVQAAAYLPGSAEPDPPTGATGRPANDETPLEGSGIRWELAPLRYAGTVSVDGRWLRLEDGTRTTQAVLINDIEFATHVWQPWFIQLRGGVGALAARDSARSRAFSRAALAFRQLRPLALGAAEDADNARTVSRSAALTGRVSIAVFPLSRFPFEFRAEANDSRVSGEQLGSNYRSRRFGLSQAWRPEQGNDSYDLAIDYSRLDSTDVGKDAVLVLRGTALRQFERQNLELTALWSGNRRGTGADRSSLATLTARHAFQPNEALQVDTMASWNELRLRSGDAVARFDSRSDIRQISSFATWRPREGDRFYSPESPMYLTGSARFVDSGAEAGQGEQRVRAANASLGVSRELSREWRVAAGVSVTTIQPDGSPRVMTSAGNALVSYTPFGLSWFGWRYAPSLAASMAQLDSSELGTRRTIGGQFSHGLSRSFTLGQADSLSFNLTQSFGAVRDSLALQAARAVAHSAGLYWQGGNNGGSQGYAALSVSDSRALGADTGRFQLVNLQLSRRTQLSRHASWSGNLTWQASRSDTTQLDPFTGVLRESSPGWQHFYSGSLSYEHQRLFDVPRLRYSLLLSVNSQQLESRLEGDIDAPRERISESLEHRVDYAIGRLETRLSARYARFETRNVTSVFARVQRRY